MGVEVYPVEKRDLRRSLLLVGTLLARESAEMRAEISGRISEVLFEEGQAVKAGQPLLQLDESELVAQLDANRASLALATSNLERVRSLAEQGTRSQADLDRALADHQKAAADVRLLEVRLARMVIRAPFDGLTGARQVSPGDYVTAASPVTTVEDLSELKVEFEVPEGALDGVRPGSEFAIDVRGLAPGAMRGEVFFISPVIERTKRSSLVRGLVRQPNPALKPGMFVMVDLTLDVRAGALVVPESAVLANQSGFSVIAARERDGGVAAEFVPVRLGLRERGIVEVTPVRGSLEAGVPVVASGVGALVILPGDRLNPRPLRAELAPAKPAAN